MFDLRKYWQEIREIEAALPQYPWLIDAAGTLVEVTAQIAAKMLHAKSHRLATEEEVAAHRDRAGSACREATKAEARRQGIETVAIQ